MVGRGWAIRPGCSIRSEPELQKNRARDGRKRSAEATTPASEGSVRYTRANGLDGHRLFDINEHLTSISVHVHLAFLFSCTASPLDDADQVAVQSQPLFTDSARILNFIAHQDDDVFTMTPDLWNSVRAGRTVRTVVFTAGDANYPCNEYIVERGLGQKLAYEVMAGVSFGGAWEQSWPVVAGKKLLQEKMPGRDVTIVYVGLANDDGLDLERLWKDLSANGQVVIQTRDARFVPVQTYTREQLILLVRQLIVDFAPTHVNTMDSGKTWPLINYPSEHTDHVHGALFALAGLQRMTPQPATVRLYRTYNALFEVDVARWTPPTSTRCMRPMPRTIRAVRGRVHRVSARRRCAEPIVDHLRTVRASAVSDHDDQRRERRRSWSE